MKIGPFWISRLPPPVEFSSVNEVWLYRGTDWECPYRLSYEAAMKDRQTFGWRTNDTWTVMRQMAYLIGDKYFIVRGEIYATEVKP